MKAKVKVKIGDIEITEQITDMDVEIKETMLGYANFLTINFYMPTQQTRSYLKNQADIQVSFDEKIVFNGKIRSVDEIIRAPTIIYRISAVDSSSQILKENTITEEYINQSPENIASDICSQLGIPIGTLSSTGKTLAYANFHGWKAKDCLEWIYNELEYFWFISRNNFNAISGISEAEGILVSKDTGLYEVTFILESNTVSSIDGWKVKCKVKPEISVGSVIQLESKKVKGSFFVLSLHHRSIYNGNQITEMIVLPLGTTYEEAKSLLTVDLNVVDIIKTVVREEMRKYEEIKTANLSTYKPDLLFADVKVGEEAQIENSRPSSELIQDQLSLKDVPLASLFAYNQAGLIFPQYSDMKSLLFSIGGRKDDHVLLGSIWDKNVQKPNDSQSGDCRLMLPVFLGSTYQSKNSQILIDNLGNIILKYKSLQIDIGDTELILSRPIKTVGDGEVIINVGAGKTVKIGGPGATVLPTGTHTHQYLPGPPGSPTPTGPPSATTSKLMGE